MKQGECEESRNSFEKKCFIFHEMGHILEKVNEPNKLDNDFMTYGS